MKGNNHAFKLITVADKEMIMTKIPGERGVEAEVGESGEDHDDESPERRDRTLEDDFGF